MSVMNVCPRLNDSELMENQGSVWKEKWIKWETEKEGEGLAMSYMLNKPCQLCCGWRGGGGCCCKGQ